MEEIKGEVIPISIEEEVRGSYLNYAMSVIVSRALPDVRDGLKPVHRRILYSMSEMGLRSDRAFKKCGRIVGDVLGKYHPHGDQSIYDALVRLAQDFSMRYPVVRPQGNFGSVDGDPPAAMRYTEAKMDRVAEEMLKDIKKETVDYGPNYDDSMQEPLVLPGAFPYLLTNGASGIAVGMATNMPPHNLREVCAAIVAYINDANISIDDLMKYIKGPDFPTGGIIFGRRGIKQAFRTGKGKITVRSKFVIETTKSGKDRIIVTEIPYAVNKANLIIKIADLVKEKRIDGISDLRDESDRDGMRIVIELKRGAVPKIVLNQLFSHTALQQNFNVTNLALVDGMPKQLNLKELVHYFVRHRVEVVTRRIRYDLKKAEERAHILEGLKIALDNIDEVVQIIKSSSDVNQARERLMERFKLSERQSQAILDMRLQKLTSLETKKIEEELREVLALIAYLKDLLSSEQKILGVVRDETEEIAQKYGDDRKTDIVADEVEEINIEDLIQKEDMVVLVSNKGFIKRVPVSSYRNQGRGGKGSSSAKLINEDFIKHLFIASTHDYILFVTNEGKAYWMKVHEIPEGSRASRGTHIKALLEISANEDITTIVSLQEFSEEHYLFMATARGIVKKVKTSDFRNARTRGIIAIKLDNGDTLITAVLTHGDSEIVIVSRNGNALRFHEDQVRAMGRASRGVTGIRLQSDDELAGILRVEDNEKMLLLSENGLGKRVEYDHFSLHGRGTRGQIAYKTSERSGEIVGVLSVLEEDDLVCITSQGNTIKLHVSDVPVQGKTAQGVNIVTITAPDVVVDVARVMNDKDEEEDQPQT
ncbi:DNA topoisomerase (ATP-hydrolyzing) subunit A [Sediminispirochaeta bajacaliforniensis]|uniref:DNA topoisomerase (ATP-hydrolyzing) subunit A n=1 Tax=Sediminispirochaeta bajacaliforniensis TaxID=148 RepID=UPI000367E739|nr:DNA topoisomerase (ATP-hydrolyzing) subunit A [Sediminispirochaeta bajacaliforniensis]